MIIGLWYSIVYQEFLIKERSKILHLNEYLLPNCAKEKLMQNQINESRKIEFKLKISCHNLDKENSH